MNRIKWPKIQNFPSHSTFIISYILKPARVIRLVSSDAKSMLEFTFFIVLFLFFFFLNKKGRFINISNQRLRTEIPLGKACCNSLPHILLSVQIKLSYKGRSKKRSSNIKSLGTFSCFLLAYLKLIIAK